MWTELFWTLLMLAVRGSAKPAAPQNLTMSTLNTYYMLHWTWAQPGTEHVTFTVQHLSSYLVETKEEEKQFWISPSSCENTSSSFCDLTHQKLIYLGCYNIRVRASVKGVPSNWSCIRFCPDKDAHVGPPSSVELTVVGGQLEVVIGDPLTSSNTSMRGVCPSLFYNILYWEHQGNRQSPWSLTSSNNRVFLPDLPPQTYICVAVQSVVESYFNKSSNFTMPECAKIGGAPPWWEIFLYFMGGALVFFLLVLPLVFIVYWLFKTAKSICFPSTTLPDSFKKFLYDSPRADRPHLLPLDPSCDQCSELIIEDLPDPAVGVEMVPPVGVERDSRCHQGSGDSGVYSFGDGASSQQLSDYSGSSAGTGDPWQDQVKMKSLTEASRTHVLRTA